MKKITKRTRIRLSYKFRDNFKDNKLTNSHSSMWNHMPLLRDKYALRYSTRRNGVWYFIPEDEQKLSLFILLYGNFCENKQTH